MARHIVVEDQLAVDLHAACVQTLHEPVARLMLVVHTVALATG
jgi:hypothetical protein